MQEDFSEEICELLHQYCCNEGGRARKHMRQHADIIRSNFSEEEFRSHRDFIINTFMHDQ